MAHGWIIFIGRALSSRRRGATAAKCVEPLSIRFSRGFPSSCRSVDFFVPFSAVFTSSTKQISGPEKPFTRGTEIYRVGFMGARAAPRLARVTPFTRCPGNRSTGHSMVFSVTGGSFGVSSGTRPIVKVYVRVIINNYIFHRFFFTPRGTSPSFF